MASTSPSIGVVARATLHAAWAASLAGAIALASFFTIANLAFGGYLIATGHKFNLEMLLIILGGAIWSALSLVFWFVVSFVFSLVITVPVSSVIATCAFPFLRMFRAAGRKVFAVVGFITGALV